MNSSSTTRKQPQIIGLIGGSKAVVDEKNNRAEKERKAITNTS